MRVNALKELYEDVTVFGIPMIFTCLRVDRNTVPQGLYVYEVRHDDDQQGIPIELANWIMVNHWGTLISAIPVSDMIPSVHNARRFIDEEKDWNYEGTVTTIETYIQYMAETWHVEINGRTAEVQA